VGATVERDAPARWVADARPTVDHGAAVVADRATLAMAGSGFGVVVAVLVVVSPRFQAGLAFVTAPNDAFDLSRVLAQVWIDVRGRSARMPTR
jgi:hypothetical protein